jgi:hypothetical protein
LKQSAMSLSSIARSRSPSGRTSCSTVALAERKVSGAFLAIVSA